MTFDDDVLSALEEAFGSDSASLFDGLEDEVSPEEAAPEEATVSSASLDELLVQLDGEILETTKGRPIELPAPRSRSIENRHVLVSLGETSYGLPLKNIQEIQQLPAVTYLPNLPDWIPGVCNLRGNIVSIVDFKQLMGSGSTALGPKTRLVVIRTEKQDLTTGIIVDEVLRITEIDPARIRRTAGPFESQLGNFLKGTYETTDAVTCILDLETTLNSPALRLK